MPEGVSIESSGSALRDRADEIRAFIRSTHD